MANQLPNRPERPVPRVSVGLPVYNGERYLAQAIEAILNQSYTDFEFIISDNASTDDTEQICRAYAAHDPRISYHRNKTNVGGPRNFNLAFQLSRGEYLKWATADDYVSPDMLEKCVSVLDHHPDVVLCYPNAEIIDAEDNLLERYDDVLDLQEDKASERFIHLLSCIGLAHQHVGVIRCSALRRTSLHADFTASDINFLAELSLYGKFYKLPEYLLHRRMHSGSSSWDRTNRRRQIEWADPKRGNRIRLDQWESMGHFFSAVRRCPAPAREKLEMYRYLLHRLYWHKGTLVQDLKWAIGARRRQIFGSEARTV